DEWCDVDVLRILRQRSLAVLRREVEPADAEALARFLPAWHGVAPVGTRPESTGADRVLEVIGQLEGLALPASALEADILAVRVRDYDPRMLDELMVSGEVMWVGAGPLGRGDGRVVLARREVAGLLLPRLGYGPADPAGSGPPPGGVGPVDAVVGRDGLHDHIRQQLAARGACFFREIGAVRWSDQEVLAALWDLVWSGEVTCDGFAAVRAVVSPASGAGRRSGGRGSGRPRTAPLPRPARPRPGPIRATAPPSGQGRWSLVGRELSAPLIDDPRVRSRHDVESAAAAVGALLERHGVLTRDAVRFEAVPGGFAGIYPVLKTLEESGRIRRGYFLSGMGGAQFALPGAVDRLRAESRRVDTGRDDPEVHVLAATDPANPYGASIPWPVKGPQRVAGAYVVLVDGLGCAYLERSGRGLVALRDPDPGWGPPVAGALADLVKAGRWRRLALQRWPDDLTEALTSAGFVPSPKGLVLYR
ncbi:MAG: hypothetical protein KGQ66_00865, partial [Acidobacteriota bacterium]|nr:hypothetical protein [Acidobacteriota bacterium]